MGRFDIINVKNIKIDETDKKILSILEENSRQNYNQIAKLVNKSADSVKYRINRLIKKNVILRFMPIIDYSKLGFYNFIVYFQMNEISKKIEKEFLEEMKLNENIINIIQYSDKYDYEVSFLAKNIYEFDSFFSKIINKYSQIIDDYNSFQSLKIYKNKFLPDNYSNLKNEDIIIKKEEKWEKNNSLDNLDTKILQKLCFDARISTYLLAEEFNTSSDTILYRIKKLKTIGVIKRFTTLINLSNLGFFGYTFFINLKSIPVQKEKEFCEFLKQTNNIIKGVRGFGESELILYIVTYNQVKYHEIVNQIRVKFGGIIKNYDTLLTFKEHKNVVFEDYLLRDTLN